MLVSATRHSARGGVVRSNITEAVSELAVGLQGAQHLWHGPAIIHTYLHIQTVAFCWSVVFCPTPE